MSQTKKGHEHQKKVEAGRKFDGEESVRNGVGMLVVARWRANAFGHPMALVCGRKSASEGSQFID
jgi:hypothetical protein